MYVLLNEAEDYTVTNSVFWYAKIRNILRNLLWYFAINAHYQSLYKCLFLTFVFLQVKVVLFLADEQIT